MRDAGGTNISWIWCPADIGDSVNTLRSLYPGDQYVDWVGTDVYPRAGQSFSSAAQVEISHIQSVAPNKPMMLPEIGYTGSDAGTWWNNMLTNVLQNQYPYISALVVWQDPTESPYDVSNLSAFQQGIASSYYSSNVFSSLKISPIPALGENPTSPTLTFQPTNYPTSNNAPVLSPLGLGVDVAIILAVVAIVYVALASKQILSKKTSAHKKSGRLRLPKVHCDLSWTDVDR